MSAFGIALISEADAHGNYDSRPYGCPVRQPEPYPHWCGAWCEAGVHNMTLPEWDEWRIGPQLDVVESASHGNESPAV